MFENFSTRSIVLGAATAVGIVASVVSIIKDCRDNAVCEEDIACEVVDPTADNA